jgi:hypothetical protein
LPPLIPPPQPQRMSSSEPTQQPTIRFLNLNMGQPLSSFMRRGFDGAEGT